MIVAQQFTAGIKGRTIRSPRSGRLNDKETFSGLFGHPLHGLDHELVANPSDESLG